LQFVGCRFDRLAWSLYADGRQFKNSKFQLRKESFVKTRESVSLSIIESAGIEPGKTEMELAAAIPAATTPTPEERQHLISEAAYYHAESRSFVPGYELDDWLNAEAEVEMMLSKSGAGNLASNE
jgi:hypothetical protein